MTSNEIRQIVGMKPSRAPQADELRNKNLNRSNEETSKVKPLDDITKERVNATSKQEE